MSNYTLNFVTVSIEGQTHIVIGQQPYDQERLMELRNTFGKTHVFQRYGRGDVIVDIPIVAGQRPLGNIQEEVDLSRTSWVWPPLLAASLVRTFSGNRDILSDYPVTVLGAAQRGLIKHADLPAWIQKRTLLKFETRWIYRGRDARTLGLVCES